LTSLACVVSFPSQQGQVLNVKTQQISEPLPDNSSSTPQLKIQMGAGSLNLSGGANKWVVGTVDYNLPELKPDATLTGNNLLISQDNKLSGNLPLSKPVNIWNLKLGNIPMDLVINAGAYDGKLDLGGIALRNLTVSDGASTSAVNFASPNPEKMQTLSYSTGASKVDFSNLANANFSEMDFSGGAGSYTLDFSGKLQQDATVHIDGGVSSFKVIIPATTPCKVTVEGGLNNINLQGTWTVEDNVYQVKGSGPSLNINLKMGVGNLDLIQQ
jgi:hypothetical protein